jgi:hypothetical protein
MDMEEVQTLVLGHIDQLARQDQLVGRVFEEGILAHIDLMEKDIPRERAQSDRFAIGDEMDLVPFTGQSFSQLGGDNSTSPIGGVTYDTDLHGRAS